MHVAWGVPDAAGGRAAPAAGRVKGPAGLPPKSMAAQTATCSRRMLRMPRATHLTIPSCTSAADCRTQPRSGLIMLRSQSKCLRGSCASLCTRRSCASPPSPRSTPTRTREPGIKSRARPLASPTQCAHAREAILACRLSLSLCASRCSGMRAAPSGMRAKECAGRQCDMLHPVNWRRTCSGTSIRQPSLHSACLGVALDEKSAGWAPCYCRRPVG